MKIFYGVQGTGNGHISRARAMNTYLKQYNVDVDFLFTGRERADYFDMDEFGNWQCLPGLTFVHSQGKISTLKTLQTNQLSRFWKDVRQLDLSQYDLVLQDFEPVTAWAAKRQGINSIGIGHQYAFHFDIPLEGDSVLTRTLIRHFAPAKTRIGLHWHHFGQPILPPIVDIDDTVTPQSQDIILVYLGFEATDEVLKLLHQCPDTQFIAYGKFSQASQTKNVALRPLSLEGFKHDLHRCNGVICNAGFELASEAIQLGKKILVKPLYGQMEQQSNAQALESLSLGWRMDHLDVNTLQKWLHSATPPKYHYPNVAKAIVSWLLTDDRPAVEVLAQTLWDQATFDAPQSVPSNAHTATLVSA